MKDFTRAPAFDIQYEWNGLDADKEEGDENEVQEREDENKQRFTIMNKDHDLLMQAIYENVERAMNEALEYSSNYCK